MSGRFYGVVTDLANAYNTNRQRVYDIGATLCKMVQHYGTIAGLILLDDEVTWKFSSACVDEIFFHGTPILTVVDPDSMGAFISWGR